MKWAGLFLICAVGAWGQIASPTLGFVPEGFGIRTMQGIPAAGVIGPILETGRSLAQITISPQQKYILAVDAAKGEVVLVTPSGATSVVAGAAANPDRIAVSPSGSSAVLWFNATNRAQIVTGLPGSPVIREIDASFLDTPLWPIAVSDNGNWIAAGSLVETEMYLFSGDGSMSTIPTGDLVTGLAFFYNRDALAIATSRRIFTADPISTGPLVLVGGLNPASNAGDSTSVDLALSSDNQRIVAAGGRLITTIDLATGVASTLDCGCEFDGLFGLGGSILRITTPAVIPVSFIDCKGTHHSPVPILGSERESVKLFDAENNRFSLSRWRFRRRRQRESHHPRGASYRKRLLPRSPPSPSGGCPPVRVPRSNRR